MNRFKICFEGECDNMSEVSGSFSVVVNPAQTSDLAINPPGGNLPDETVGTEVDDKVCDVTGGTPPYTFAVTGGQIPPGTAFSSATNDDGSESVFISGTPSSPGAFSFNLTVTDSAGASKTLSTRKKIG